MFEKLSLAEAHHILSDFFEIHTEASEKKAKTRASKLLDDIQEGESVTLGSLPTVKVGKALVSYLPEGFEPEDIYLLQKDSGEKGYSKKISLTK